MHECRSDLYVPRPCRDGVAHARGAELKGGSVATVGGVDVHLKKFVLLFHFFFTRIDCTVRLTVKQIHLKNHLFLSTKHSHLPPL